MGYIKKEGLDMDKEFIRGELLLWLDCFGKDWVDFDKYRMVEHEFSGDIQIAGFLESNEDIDLPPTTSRDMLLRISNKGLEFLGMEGREQGE